MTRKTIWRSLNQNKNIELLLLHCIYNTNVLITWSNAISFTLLYLWCMKKKQLYDMVQNKVKKERVFPNTEQNQNVGNWIEHMHENYNISTFWISNTFVGNTSTCMNNFLTTLLLKIISQYIFNASMLVVCCNSICFIYYQV